ncbi:MAG: indole-3-glycerol phosphate synthase TrpC [Acidimicrobiales bacterium]|nr:indole-3-glycerol phosphate synthase TrpC [Acidimicrobiales bacterium]
MSTYLDAILEFHREQDSKDQRKVANLEELASKQGPTRGFFSRIATSNDVSFISEIKRKSPSKGVLKPDLDVQVLASEYENGGATCLSVLTDSKFFGGSTEDLENARSCVSIPVLRKDFTISLRDVFDARIMGADAVLLIAAALDGSELKDLYSLAKSIGLDVLVEIHDEIEGERALEVGADLIGINQRDLYTFAVDAARAIRVKSSLPENVTTVAESGIENKDDIAAISDAGFDAVLIGEYLVKSTDARLALKELVEIGKRS